MASFTYKAYQEEIAVGLPHAQKGARDLVQGLLEANFIETDNDVTNPVEDQTILAAAFKEIVKALEERRKRNIDPRCRW